MHSGSLAVTLCKVSPKVAGSNPDSGRLFGPSAYRALGSRG
jgi:hypothetical protein